ncbi:YjzD family protein [Pontibacillus salicampi]|uniref:YjzD family protein n=1 Tax=Pontibacillus salicampi TaxID=1449801 RepID=A0ABV6LQV6_9BACI
MRLFWTIFWSFLLSLMVTYVVSSINVGPFKLTNAIVLTVGFTLTVVLLAEGGLKEESDS